MDQAETKTAEASRLVERRVARLDWDQVAGALDEAGHARLPGLVTRREAASLRRDFGRPALFRKHVDMGRHAYGEGDYRYFAAPLPSVVQSLRAALYPPLAAIANDWQERLGEAPGHPATLEAFVAECASAGQPHPTPLLLHYEAGGYNRMHQDRYGEIVFPLQVVCLLSSPRDEFDGGQVLISEQRPRMQTRVDAVDLELGDGLVFAASERPVRSARGFARATMRHGVATVRRGERYTLGLIFHDAAS